jgi:hypothetical protein
MCARCDPSTRPAASLIRPFGAGRDRSSIASIPLPCARCWVKSAMSTDPGARDCLVTGLASQRPCLRPVGRAIDPPTPVTKHQRSGKPSTMGGRNHSLDRNPGSRRHPSYSSSDSTGGVKSWISRMLMNTCFECIISFSTEKQRWLAHHLLALEDNAFHLSLGIRPRWSAHATTRK